MFLGQSARGADPPVPAPAGAAAELPDFQPGLWEYRRMAVTSDSARPRLDTLRKCADPSAEIRSKKAQLESRGCQFAPFVRRDGRYVSSWTCPTPEGPVTYRHMLIVTDRTSYAAISEIRLGRQRMMHQKMQARRLGECPHGAPSSGKARQTSAARDAEIDAGRRYGVIQSPSAVSRDPWESLKRTM
jgi:hypothetical protein